MDVKLPVPMWAIKPTITGEHLLIVGYSYARGRDKRSFQIPVTTITSVESPVEGSTKWETLWSAPHYNTATLPYSDPPLIIGGRSGL